MTKKEIIKRNIEEAKKIVALETFLQEWKNKVTRYALNLRKEFIEGESTNWELEGELTEKELQKIASLGERHKSEWQNYYCKQHFMAKSKWHKIVGEHYDSHGYTFEELVEKIMNKDLDAKRASLIEKVKKHIGTITDASNLFIGLDGEINGFIIGADGAVSVQTIGAGGYNVQCYHFRCLVKKLKEIPVVEKQSEQPVANECEALKTLPSEITGEEREATRELFNNIVQIKDIKNVSPFMSKDEMDAIKSLFIRSNVKVINNVLRHMDDVKSILRSNRNDDEYDVYCTMMSKLFHTREEMQYRGEWAQLESGM